MGLNEIIARHKKHLTKAQVSSLAKLSNEYKQLNAGRRAEAYEDLYTNHQDFRRGLQNMGLASRRGNIISGREVMGQVRVDDAYHRFNDQLKNIEDRMLDNAAGNMRAQNIARQQAAQPRNFVDNLADQIKQQYAAKKEFNENAVDPRIGNMPKPTKVQPQVKVPQVQGDIDPRFAQPVSAPDKANMARIIPQARTAQRTANVQDAVAQAFDNANRAADPEHYKALDNQLITQQVAYQQNMPKWDKAIADGERAANDPDSFGSVTRQKYLSEANKAKEEKAKALSDINRAYTASKLQKNVGELVMLSDDDFNIRYDAAQKAAEKAQKAYSEYKEGGARFRTDSEWIKTHPDALKSGNIKTALEDDYKRTQTVLARFEQAKQSRNDTAQMEFYADEFAIPESKKVKQKDYASVTDFVRENQTDPRRQELTGKGNRLGWAGISDDTGRNWKEAEERGWKATDYENRTKTHAKYDALVNEWSIINGDTTNRYTMEGKFDETFAGVAPKLSGRDKSGYMYYDKFRNKCTEAFYGYGASSEEHEQMETMLTLANLMTDEERAKYNAIHNQAGANKADEYFEFLYKNVLPQRFDACLAERNGIYTNTGLDKLVASAASVPMNLAEGATGAIHQTVTGQSDPTAAKLGAARYNTAQATRDTVSKDFSDGTWGGKWWYGAAMSAADSAAVALVSAGLGKLFASAGVPTEAMIGGKTVNVAEEMGALAGGSLLGGAAYNAEYSDALARGLSPDKARIQASGVAFNEMLFESLSVDMILNQFKHGGALKIAKNNVANWLINTGAQGVVEMSEEDFTSLANKWFDEKLNGIMSKELTTMRGYMNDGMSFEEAKKRVSEEFADELFSEGMAGFVTGAGMGGGASLLGMFKNGDLARKGASMTTKQKQAVKDFKYNDSDMADLASAKKLTNEDYGILWEAQKQQLLEQYEGNVQKAVEAGVITAEDAALLDKYQKNGVQAVDENGNVTGNENGVTEEEYQRVNEALKQLDITPLMKIVNAEEQMQFNKEVGVKNAELLIERQANLDKAASEYNKTVAEINADTTLTDDQKAQKIAAADVAKASAESKAEEKFGSALAKTKIGQLKIDGNTVATGKGSGKVTFDFSTDKHYSLNDMTEHEKAALRIAQVIAQSTGTNIKVESQFVGNHTNENGYYNTDTNTIHVNLSGTNSVVWTISHELTHHLKAVNEAAYNDLAAEIKKQLGREDLVGSDLPEEYQNAVGKYMTGENTLYDALVTYEQERYKKNNINLTKEGAEEEVVARCCEQFLAKSAFVNAFAKQHYKSAKSIAAFLTRINADMQSLYADVNERGVKAATTRNAEGKYEYWNTDASAEQDILNQIADVDRIAKLWEKGVREIADKRAKAKKATREIKASQMDKSSSASQRNYSMEEFNRLYKEGVRAVKVKDLSAFKNKKISSIDQTNVASFALRRVQSMNYKSDNAGYVFFESTGTKATVTENSFRHGSADKSVEYMIACMNISELAKSAIPVNELNLSENHTNPGTIYFAIAQTNRSAFLVRMVVENGTGEVDGLNVLYAIKKESPSVAPASAQSQTVTRTDTDSVRLKELDELVRVSSIVNIKDFLEFVNSFEMGKSSLPLDVLKNLNSTRHNEPKITPNLRYSIMDKDFRMTKRGNVRTFEQNGTTANVIGSSVELEGGSLLNRVRMLQNLAEEYGSVRVDAASEKEAEAFRRAGAQKETDAFSNAEHGTWVFEHTESKYEKDSQYDAKQKRNFADAVLKEVGTRKNFTQDELRVFKAKLEKAFAVLHNATFGKGDQLAAYEYADKLFDSILNRYSEMSEADADMREAILAEMPRTYDGKGRIFHEIEVTEGQMAEIKHAFGSVAAYNQALSKALGTRVYVRQTENAKTLEDIFASDSRFDATTNEGDMPGALLNMAQETIAKRTNPLKAESQERTAAKEAMFEKALSIVGVEKSAAQKVREAVKEARAEERVKAKDNTAKAVSEARLAERMHEGAIRAQERRASAEREVNIKRTAANREAKLKEITKQKLEQQKTEQLRRDVKRVALKWNQRLVKMLANPTEASHIPIQLAQEVAEFTKALTEYIDSGTERGRLNLEKIKRAYEHSFADESIIAEAKAEDPHFDPRGLLPVEYDKEGKVIKDETLIHMIDALNEVTKDRTFKDLSAHEMRMLLNTVRAVGYKVYEANRMIGTEERKAIWKVGSTMVNQLEATHVSKKMRGYLETSLDLRRIAKIFSNSDENAEFVKLVDQLNKGAIEKERIAQVLQDMFKPVTDQYGDEIRKWYGNNAEWIDTGITKHGKKVEITKGMRVSLALHVLNEGNMRHIENGGLTIPEREMYRKGKMKDAYANGELVRLSKKQIYEIISHMTDAEKAYVAVAKEFFHKRTGYYVNKTSLQLLGYRKAIVENYFPIHTDQNYTKTDFASLKMDGSIEGQGFLKERVLASNPVYLEDITSVVNRQIRGVALYAGLAVPMRNFNAVMNAAVYEDDNGVWSPRTTVKQAMTKQMGDYGAKVVQGFLTDVSEMSHVDVSTMERFAGKLGTNYVKAVLLGNLKVAMKQVASYPTAAAVIPWKYLAKALRKGESRVRKPGHIFTSANVDLINQYTPLYQMRRAEQANEIASIMQRRGMEDKLPWLLGWITKFDVATVGRLWSAAEYMVADQQKNLVKGSDAYYKAVAQVFNDTVQQTQPNFTPLQRNAVLRSKNPVVRSLGLFGTQKFQNGGILLEAAYELKQSKGKSKAEIQAAKVKLGRAVASQIVQNILLIVASLGVDALRGRMKAWQDEKEKKVTLESVAFYMGDMFLSNFTGSFLFGSETYGIISNFLKKKLGKTTYETEFTVPAIDALTTIINFVETVLPEYDEYMTGTDEDGNPNHTTEEKLNKTKKFSMNLAKVAGYVTGIPFENAVKDLFKGFIPMVQDHIDLLNTGDLSQWWLHQSGKLDKAKTAANYKEWTNEGKKGSVYLYWENALKDVSTTEEKAEKLFEDLTLTSEEKATLLRMFTGNSRYPTMSEGTVVYNSSGEVIADFSNLDAFRVSQLSDAKYAGYQKAVEMGVPSNYASTAFVKFTEYRKDGAGYNQKFREWMKMVGATPEQRAKLELCVIGDEGTQKRYTVGQELIKTGMNANDAYLLIENMRDTKKDDSEKYLSKLTEKQKKLIYEWKGWKYGK